MNRRAERQDLMSIPIDDKITNRYYQKEVIRADRTARIVFSTYPTILNAIDDTLNTKMAASCLLKRILIVWQ